MDEPAAGRKQDLRRDILRGRSRMRAPKLAAAADAIEERLLALPEVGAARCVAAYVSIGTEPGTRHLIDTLAARGVVVLLPVLLANNELDWVEHTGSDVLRPAARGLVEPDGPRLGTEALRRADVVIVPALAVDLGGTRLGRGAGCYDRALHQVREGAVVVALLHDGELLARQAVPEEPHDVRIDVVCQPGALTRIS